MADIDIKCPDCQAITQLSEFAEVRSIQCKSCKRTIEIQRGRPVDTTRKGLQLSRPRPSTTPEEGTVPQEGYLATMKPPKQKRRTSAWRPSQHVTAWAFFLVLGTAMWFLRYEDVLSKPQLVLLKQFAPLVVLGFHILILLKAFQDSIFQGILCLFIPGYSFVYLFFITDDFYARATFGGLLVGMAEDSFYYYQDKVIAGYQAITAWLERGA